jgi:pyridoxal 5'-phosphate synthase pdxT subunit
MTIIGILALQGDFDKHKKHLSGLGVKVKFVRLPEDLSSIDGFIIPGGESTTIGKLLDRSNMLEPLKDLISKGLPVYGTCAGTILLAKSIEEYDQVKLGVMNITVARNAYGRQVDSFETDINLKICKEPFRCVFIRAPVITKTGKNVKVLGVYNNYPVLIQEGNILASTFHPELTDNTAVHKYFLEHFIKNKQS